MERQRTANATRRDREGRGETPDREDLALVQRYERLLAAIERIAASRERTGLSARLGRSHLHRPTRA
jgi:hypothetical protein